MIPSPLSLKTRFFTHIEVVANPCSEGETGKGCFASHVDCRRHEDEPNHWVVQLGVRMEAEDGKTPPPYTFQIIMIGVFTLSEEFETKDRDTFVKINGAAMLYGAVREMVTNLTARGPHEEFDLPAVTFVDEVKATKE